MMCKDLKEIVAQGEILKKMGPLDSILGTTFLEVKLNQKKRKKKKEKRKNLKQKQEKKRKEKKRK